jgi:hypothetical protein
LASKKPVVTPKKTKDTKTWAEGVAYRQKAMNSYQTERNKVKEVKDEFETKMERSKAADQAAKELKHLSAISEEVLIHI